MISSGKKSDRDVGTGSRAKYFSDLWERVKPKIFYGWYRMKTLLSLFRFSRIIEVGISLLAVIFMVTAVVFWSVGIRNYFYSHFVQVPMVAAQQGLGNVDKKAAATSGKNSKSEERGTQRIAAETPRGASENISGDTMLAIISVLAIIAGLLSWVFLKLIRTELQQEITDRLNDERECSVARTMVTTGYLLWFYHHNTQAKAGVKHKETPFLDGAIDMAGMGLESAVTIKNKKYEELIFICKNNLAFYMAYRDNAADKQSAYDLARELYEIATSSAGKKYPSRCHWLSTWIFVLRKFYGDKPWAQVEAKKVKTELEDDASFSPDEKKKIEELWSSLREKGLVAD
jgi:hypothetical protein